MECVSSVVQPKPLAVGLPPSGRDLQRLQKLEPMARKSGPSFPLGLASGTINISGATRVVTSSASSMPYRAGLLYEPASLPACCPRSGVRSLEETKRNETKRDETNDGPTSGALVALPASSAMPSQPVNIKDELPTASIHASWFMVDERDTSSTSYTNAHTHAYTHQ